MPLNRFDLNLLIALDALLRERNVTRAAERVCISQPAMSGALQRLREYFEDPLLVRIGRDMELTPRAQSLVKPVREILLLTQSTLESRPTFEPQTAGRAFTLVMSDYCLRVFMSQALRHICAVAPCLQINVESIGGTTMARLESGEVDLCLIPDHARLWGPADTAGLFRRERLFSDRWACVVDREHPTVRDELTLEQYLELPHAFARFGGATVTIEQLALNRLARDVRVAATAPGFVSAALMVPGTTLVATVQERLAKMLETTTPIRLLKPPIDLPVVHESMVWHERSEADPGHQWLRQTLAAIAAAF